MAEDQAGGTGAGGTGAGGTGTSGTGGDAGTRARTIFEDFGRKLDSRVGEAAPRVEEEVRKVIAYLNDEVVPQIRQNSSEALRIAAQHLARIAEHLDRPRGGER